MHAFKAYKSTTIDSMIIIIFAILDILAGGMLLLGEMLSLQGTGFLFWFFVVFFLKSLYSILAAAASGFYFDILGWIDMIGSIFLLLMFWGIYPGFVFWIGVILIIKGFYSFAIAFMS